MSIAARATPLGLSHEMRSFIGRHTEKSFDWDAFPGSRGFPELARAQMRYIGAGGSPKADDPSTLKPGRFHVEFGASARRQVRRLSFP
jgi:hypothetical protein